MSGVGRHTPVMLAEVLAALRPTAGECIVDATFGAGGYSRAILDAAPCRVWAIDRDPAARPRAQSLERDYGDRFHLLGGPFSEMADLLGAAGVDRVDGVAFDLGVSSPQLDDPARGFSFQSDGPLDMRMSGEGPTAADLVNGSDAADLADILWRYGEERHSRRIARAIVARRAERPFLRTLDLADLVARQLPRSRDGIHPATRTFQGLRIAVNDELGELARALAAAERLLVAGGRLVVVAFHSLEDRLVKQFLTARTGRTPRESRHRPLTAERAASFDLLFVRAQRPAPAETAANPRARSARLRAAVRTAAPAWPAEAAA